MNIKRLENNRGRPLISQLMGSRCIYCLNELSDDRQTSLEHIVQASIGGSTVFSTRDCCKPCNDRLGAEIDAPFVDGPPLNFLRVTYDLRGQSRTVPTYRFRGVAVEENVDAQIVMAPGRLEPRLKPSVRKSRAGDIETTEVSGSTEQVREIVGGQIKAAKAKSQKLIGPDGGVLQSVDVAMAQAHATPLRTFSFRVDYNPLAYGLGLLKIAYGAAYFFQGPEWLHTQSAVQIRQILDEPSKATAEALDHWLKNADARMLEIFTGKINETEHAIFSSIVADELCIGISLFTRPDRDFSMINLGKPARIPTSPSDKVGVVIAPQTRATRWLTVSSMYRELASRMLGVDFDLEQIENDVRRGLEPTIKSIRD